jgi:uncharacterized protein (DUF3084 family)
MNKLSAWARSLRQSVSSKEARAAFFGQMTTRKASAVVAASTLVIGLILGSSIAASAAKSEIAVMSSDLADANASISLLEVEKQEADEEAEKAIGEADSAQKTAAANRTKLDAANKKLTELEAAAAVQLEEIATRDARIAELETQVASRAAPVAPAPSAPNTSAYYQNCTAARAAGAAPVRAGDPGYGRHLDRDGDGIGCE